MSVAPALPLFDERRDPGLGSSIAAALAVHVLLLAVLFIGVRWQSRAPDTVEVELWSEPPPVQAQPKPVPKVEPVPPPPAPKPEPVIERPDIVVKEPVKPKPVPEVKPKPIPEAKPKPVPEAKPAPKPVAKAEPLKPRVDETQKRMREELAREQAAIADERERRAIRDQLARDSASTSARALEEYVGRIRAKVRGNWILPQDLKGNPEAVFLVVQLPTGEVLSVKLARSSGIAAYDDAVERAILKSSPLPRPDRPELFSRELRLTFRPRD